MPKNSMLTESQHNVLNAKVLKKVNNTQNTVCLDQIVDRSTEIQIDSVCGILQGFVILKNNE